MVDQDKVSVVFRDGGKPQPLVELIRPFVGPEAADEDRKSSCVSLYASQRSRAYALPLEGREKMNLRYVEEVGSFLQLKESGVSAVYRNNGKFLKLLEVSDKFPPLEILIPAPEVRDIAEI